MDDLIKLVKTYRVTAALDQRLRLATEIFNHIEPKMRAFVFGSIASHHAPDVLQEVLKAIAVSLRKFQGGTTAEFWKWCYQIARNKRADHFRRHASDRLQPMDDVTLKTLVDSSIAPSTLRPGDRLDVEFAMKLLMAAQPECRTLLWSYYVQGLDYDEIAEERGVTYDAARMRIGRCLEEARALVA